MFTFSVSTNVALLNKLFWKVSPAAGDFSHPLVCDNRYYFLTQRSDVMCGLTFPRFLLPSTCSAGSHFEPPSSLPIKSAFFVTPQNESGALTLRTLESFWFTVHSPVTTSVRWVSGVAKWWVYSASRSCEFHPARLSSPFLPRQSPHECPPPH